MIITDDMEYIYDESEIHNLSPDEQREEMLKWFQSRYEDPVHSCPRNDGEFNYIYGGPYEARDILESEFGDLVSTTTIEEVADELECECCYWSAKEPKNWYDDYDIDYINNFLVDEDTYETFKESVEKALNLLNAECDSNCKNTLLKMIYANIITSLETYLSEAFIKNIFKTETNLINFMAKNTELVDKKYTLKQIYQKDNLVEIEIKEYLSSIMWHNIKKVSSFYKFSFNVKFPGDIKDIYKAVTIRHDIVHRNGKTKEGSDIFISETEIQKLAEQVKDLVTNIEEQINPKTNIEDLI